MSKLEVRKADKNDMEFMLDVGNYASEKAKAMGYGPNEFADLTIALTANLLASMSTVQDEFTLRRYVEQTSDGFKQLLTKCLGGRS